MHVNAHPHAHVRSRTCSEVFGVVELCHTSCHLSAVSRVPQSFKSAWLVMRADGKRWDSSISPPTHTEGDRVSRDKTTGCTLLCQHAWKLVCVWACVRFLQITLNFSWHFTYSSAEVMVSLLARSPSPTLYFLLSHFLSSSTPCLLPSALYIRSCFSSAPGVYPSLMQSHLWIRLILHLSPSFSFSYMA